MIQQRLTINNAPLLRALAFLENALQIIDAEFDRAFDDVKPHLSDELTYAPAAPKYPLEWQTEKQRRAFFATQGFGGGIPYARSGALQSSWVIEKDGSGGHILVTVRNPTPYSKYVVGSLAKSNPGGFMQRMHVNSGWQPAYETVDYWLGVMQGTFIQNMLERMGEVTGHPTSRTRAYTGRTLR